MQTSSRSKFPLGSVLWLRWQDLRGFLDQFGLRIEPAVQYLDRSWAVAASADAT
jgi:hypothetical protein